MTMTDLSHRCRRGERCPSREQLDDGSYTGAGIEDPGLCDICEDRAFDAIRQLAADHATLQQFGLHLPRAAGDGVAGTAVAGSRVLIRADVDEVATAIAEETARWARILTRGDEMRDVEAQCAAITTRLGTLVDQPARIVTVWSPNPDGGDDPAEQVMDGVDAVLRLAFLHHRARAVLGLDERVTMLPDPCPGCGLKALAASRDQERVTCKSCGVTWDREHFALLDRVLDFDRRALRAADSA